MFEILSMPTMTDRDLQTLLGNDFSLAQSITREELCKRQNQDKDINMIKGFLSQQMPSLSVFNKLFPSERSRFLFSKRHLLFLTPDDILCIRRSEGQQVMDSRFVLPLSLTYRAVLLSHCVGTNLHRSILATYKDLHQKFLIHDLQKHVKYFIRACKLCFVSKAAKPNPKHVPGLYPSFLKAKNATPDALVYSDLSGRLVESEQGHDHFIIYFSYFTNHVQIYPLKSCSSNAVLLSLTSYIANYPLSHLVTDPGSSYTSNVIKSACDSLRIKHTFSPILSPVRNSANKK